MDFNLFGMNHIHIDQFKFRRSLKLVDENGQLIDPSLSPLPNPDKQWDINSIKEYFKNLIFMIKI